jgi:hypothetical protein
VVDGETIIAELEKRAAPKKLLATLIVFANARLDLTNIDTYLTTEAGQATAQAYAARYAD